MPWKEYWPELANSRAFQPLSATSQLSEITVTPGSDPASACAAARSVT